MCFILISGIAHYDPIMTRLTPDDLQTGNCLTAKRQSTISSKQDTTFNNGIPKEHIHKFMIVAIPQANKNCVMEIPARFAAPPTKAMQAHMPGMTFLFRGCNNLPRVVFYQAIQRALFNLAQCQFILLTKTGYYILEFMRH